MREMEAERPKLPDYEVNLLELSGEHLCKSQNVVERSTGEFMVHAARILRLLGPEARAELGLLAPLKKPNDVGGVGVEPTKLKDYDIGAEIFIEDLGRAVRSYAFGRTRCR